MTQHGGVGVEEDDDDVLSALNPRSAKSAPLRVGTVIIIMITIIMIFIMIIIITIIMIIIIIIITCKNK